jgi:hypothetical protein
MGNTLCGHAAPGVAGETAAADGKAAAAPEQQQLQPCGSKQKTAQGGAERNSTVSLIAAAAGGRRRSSSDEIEAALNSARAELKAGAARSFAATYSTGRIIGHGAYCKVMACTHNQTGQEFAVKAVGKAADDRHQKEGARCFSIRQQFVQAFRSSSRHAAMTAGSRAKASLWVCERLDFPPKPPCADCAGMECLSVLQASSRRLP